MNSTQVPEGEGPLGKTAKWTSNGLRPFSIVCFSSQEWRTPLPTNRQQIMLRAARRGHRVLFVETSDFVGKHLWRAVQRADRRSLLARLVATEQVEAGIRARKTLNVFPWGSTRRSVSAVNWRITSALLRRLIRSLPQPVVLWIYDPGAARAIGACGEAFAVYDCVDDYAEQTISERKRAFVADADRRAVERARIVFTTSRTMYERQRRINPATHLVPNVGDYEHFNQALTCDSIPDDAAGLPRPVVGFAGNFVPSKVDFALLSEVARARPQWSFLMIGPAAAETEEKLVDLARLPNVRWLGQKPYRDLPSYVAIFDVGLIPYLSNAYTRSCFPLKLYEYLAAGKPVVATGLPELAGMEPDVLLVSGAAAVVGSVERSLPFNSDNQRRRTEIAARNSWEARAERLLRLVDAEL